MQIAKLWKRPTFVYAKICEFIMPLDRATRYEDPLAEALAAQGLGEITGGGSLVSKEGEIEYVGIDLDLLDLKRALPVAATVLDQCGAPRGSQLEYRRRASDLTYPFGSTECVAIYLDGTNLPDPVYSSTDTDALADLLSNAMAFSHSGRFVPLGRDPQRRPSTFMARAPNRSSHPSSLSFSHTRYARTHGSS